MILEYQLIKDFVSFETEIKREKKNERKILQKS